MSPLGRRWNVSDVAGVVLAPSYRAVRATCPLGSRSRTVLRAWYVTVPQDVPLADVGFCTMTSRNWRSAAYLYSRCGVAPVGNRVSFSKSRDPSPNPKLIVPVHVVPPSG